MRLKCMQLNRVGMEKFAFNKQTLFLAWSLTCMQSVSKYILHTAFTWYKWYMCLSVKCIISRVHDAWEQYICMIVCYFNLNLNNFHRPWKTPYKAIWTCNKQDFSEKGLRIATWICTILGCTKALSLIPMHKNWNAGLVLVFMLTLSNRTSSKSMTVVITPSDD